MIVIVLFIRRLFREKRSSVEASLGLSIFRDPLATQQEKCQERGAPATGDTNTDHYVPHISPLFQEELYKSASPRSLGPEEYITICELPNSTAPP